MLTIYGDFNCLFSALASVRAEPCARRPRSRAPRSLQQDALPRPTTPTLVLEDGYVSRGLGALTRLARLVPVSST
jgi:hypothetical protein